MSDDFTQDDIQDDNQDAKEELTPEEIAELKEKAQRAEELEEVLKSKEEELEKFSKKDFNFRRFEQAKEEEKKEMLEKFSNKEKILINEMSELRNKFTEAENERISFVKQEVYESLGADDELKKRLDDAVKESIAFMGEPKTPTEVRERYIKAYKLLKEDSSSINPLNSFQPVTGYTDSTKRKKFLDTKEGEDFLSNNFPKLFPKK